MIVVTQWVAGLPGAVGRITAFGIGPLIAASCGLVLMGLLRTPLRWSGAIVLAASIVWALAIRQPDVLVSSDGRAMAVRGKDNRLHLMRTARDAFLVREWLAADADARNAADASLADGVSCDDAGCVVEITGGGFIAQSQRADSIEEDCDRAALIVAARQPPKDCAANVIDQARLRRQGSLGAVAGEGWICGGGGKAPGLRPAVVAGPDRGQRERHHGHLAAIGPPCAGRDAVGGRSSGGRVGHLRRLVLGRHRQLEGAEMKLFGVNGLAVIKFFAASRQLDQRE